MIPTAQGAHTTPSLAVLTVEGEVLVGTAAERQEDVAGLILARLRQDAEAYVGCPVTDAVLTVPVGFGHDQRAAPVRAGQRAGFSVLRLINDP